MITKHDIIAFAKRITGRGSHATGPTLHPVRDWYIGLAVALIIGASGALYAANIFITALQAGDAQSSSEPSIAGYDEDAVGEVLERYRARRETFDTLQGSAPPPAANAPAPAPAGASSDLRAE